MQEAYSDSDRNQGVPLSCETCNRYEVFPHNEVEMNRLTDIMVEIRNIWQGYMRNTVVKLVLAPRQNHSGEHEHQGLHNQDNLADMCAALHQFVRLNNIFQWKAGCNQWFDFTAFD